MKQLHGQFEDQWHLLPPENCHKCRRVRCVCEACNCTPCTQLFNLSVNAEAEWIRAQSFAAFIETPGRRQLAKIILCYAM